MHSDQIVFNGVVITFSYLWLLVSMLPRIALGKMLFSTKKY